MSLRDEFAKAVDLADYRAELEAMGASKEDVDASVADLERRRQS
jgi:hypothetical protein